MNGLRLISNVIISATVLFFVGGCSIRPEQAGQTFGTDRGEVSREIREIAWKAYGEATGLRILAEESAVAGDEFILFRDVQGLGKKGDKICEVRFAILGGAETRGLVLVNEKRGQSLVVFPKKKDISPCQNKPGKF